MKTPIWAHMLAIVGIDIQKFREMAKAHLQWSLLQSQFIFGLIVQVSRIFAVSHQNIECKISIHGIRPRISIPERWPSRHLLRNFRVQHIFFEILVNFGSIVVVVVQSREVQARKERWYAGDTVSARSRSWMATQLWSVHECKRAERMANRQVKEPERGCAKPSVSRAMEGTLTDLWIYKYCIKYCACSTTCCEANPAVSLARL